MATSTFDGDTTSVTSVLSEEAKNEVKQKLSSVDYYVDINDRMYFSGETDITKLVLGTLTAWGIYDSTYLQVLLPAVRCKEN